MWRRLIVIPAIAAVVLGALVSLEVAHPAVLPDRPSAREREEIRARETFHLSIDLRLIRYADAHFGPSYVGAPITTAERSRLRSQSRIGRHIPNVVGLVNEQPGFAGIWSELDGDGAIGIGWVGAVPSTVRHRVAAALPKSTPVHFVEEKYTLAQLKKIQYAVSAVMTRDAEPADGTPTIYTAYVRTPDNRVEITVATKADVTAAYRLFGHDGVHVEVGGQPVTAQGSAP